MPFLARGEVQGICDKCRAHFDPAFGGVCTSCHRILCSNHFYGSLVAKLLGFLGISHPAMCAECRARGGAPK